MTPSENSAKLSQFAEFDFFLAGHTKRPRRSRGASDISTTTDTSVIEGKDLNLVKLTRD